MIYIIHDKEKRFEDNTKLEVCYLSKLEQIEYYIKLFARFDEVYKALKADADQLRRNLENLRQGHDYHIITNSKGRHLEKAELRNVVRSLSKNTIENLNTLRDKELISLIVRLDKEKGGN